MLPLSAAERSVSAAVHHEAVQVRVGTLFVPLQVPVNPKDVAVPAARAPFHAVLVTVAVAPLVVSVPLHNWPMVCPLAKVHATFQPLMAEVPELVTLTFAWKPVGQELTTV